jgi:hypothetical protein
VPYLYHIESLLSMTPPPDWLVKLHQKLWKKPELLDQIIYTMTLDVTDFITLQIHLDAFIHPAGLTTFHKIFLALNLSSYTQRRA